MLVWQLQVIKDYYIGNPWEIEVNLSSVAATEQLLSKILIIIITLWFSKTIWKLFLTSDFQKPWVKSLYSQDMKQNIVQPVFKGVFSNSFFQLESLCFL